MSENENYTSELNQTRKMPVWSTGIGQTFLIALNIFLSITALLGNALILVALHKESSIHSPTKLLFRWLAVTDLCVGLITQPLLTAYLMSPVTTGMNWRVVHYIDLVCKVSSFILCEVSVFTSSAISVDRLLALLLGLRYRHVVTLKRVRALVICFWLIGVIGATVFLWNSSIAFIIAFVLTLLSLATSVFSYTKVYLKLKHRRLNFPQRWREGGRFPLNIARYKKSVSSVLWVQLALVTCYTPFIVVVMLTTSFQMSPNKFEMALPFTATLTYLSSSLNPILYCWRIGAVRQAAKDTIKHLNCCKSA